MRMKRLKKEGGKWRPGEKKLDDFWTAKEECKNIRSRDKGSCGNASDTNAVECAGAKKLKHEQTSA